MSQLCDGLAGMFKEYTIVFILIINCEPSEGHS